MKKWFVFWALVVAGLYGIYSYTIDAVDQFNANVGTAIERVAGRRN
jgi:hypothetical protein